MSEIIENGTIKTPERVADMGERDAMVMRALDRVEETPSYDQYI